MTKVNTILRTIGIFMLGYFVVALFLGLIVWFTSPTMDSPYSDFVHILIPTIGGFALVAWFLRRTARKV